MKKNLKIKFLVFFLILNLFFSPFYEAEAFIVHDPGHTVVTAANKILHGIQIGFQKLEVFSSGLPGSGAATRGALKTVEKACNAFERFNKIVETADNFGGLEVIGGGAAEIAKISTKITALNIVRNCYDGIRTGSIGASAIAATGNQSLSTLVGQDQVLATLISGLDQRIDRLKELRGNATKDMWKAVALRILMNAQNRLTARLVNKMVEKYRIGNVLQYADAAASFVYNVDYINRNFASDKEKMIVSAILKNQAFEDYVMPSVRAKAYRALDYVPQDLDLTSPDYYIKMGKAGTGEADPFFLQTIYNGKADQVKSQSRQAAQNEISSSEGFAPVRDCNGSIAQQQAFDQKNIRLSYEVRQKEEALFNLQINRAANPRLVDPKEIDRARLSLDSSRDQLLALPETSKPVVEMCKAITNPGAFVSKSIGGYLSAHLGNAANVKSENLPFFANFIEGVANNLVSGIIENQKPGLNILTDAGIRAANIATTQYLSSIDETRKLKEADVQAAQDSTVFVAENSGNSEREYIFKWDLQNLSNVQRVVLTGPSFNRILTEKTGNLRVTLANQGDYTLTAFDNSNQVVTKKTINISILSSPTLNVPSEGSLEQQNNNATNIANQVKPPSPTDADVYNDCIASGKTPAQCNQNENSANPGAGAVCGGNYTSKTACVQQTNDQSYCDSLCGNVQGAFVSRPTEPIRGGMPVIKPRGGYLGSN